MRKNNNYFTKLLDKDLTKENNKGKEGICEMFLNILKHDTANRDLAYVNDVLNEYAEARDEFLYYDPFGGVENNERILVLKEIPEKTLKVLKMMSAQLSAEKEQTL